MPQEDWQEWQEIDPFNDEDEEEIVKGLEKLDKETKGEEEKGKREERKGDSTEGGCKRTIHMTRAAIAAKEKRAAQESGLQRKVVTEQPRTLFTPHA